MPQSLPQWHYQGLVGIFALRLNRPQSYCRENAHLQAQYSKYCCMMPERITVLITAGMMIFSPVSSLRVFDPKATSWVNSGLRLSGDELSEMVHFIVVDCRIVGTGWPFPASIACWRAWSMRHLESPGFVSWSSAVLEKSSAKRESICRFVRQWSTCWYA